mmetsp:Transcript_24638/g.53279  ORF Transcript_24638/g.53279 Transcript_24638/m.53279 type:complete len:462 (-) Transcript_24638:209-1594(-)
MEKAGSHSGAEPMLDPPQECGPRWLRLLATAVGACSAGLDFLMVLAIMPAVAEVYQDQNIFVGVLVFCKYFAQLCTNPCAAYSVYRMGPWPTGLAGLLIYCIATGVFALTSELFGVLAVTMVFQGVGAALLFNGTQEAMLRHYSADLQGDAVSYGMVGLSSGLFLGPIYGGVVYDLLGFEWCFLIVSFGFLLLFLGGCVCLHYATQSGIPGAFSVPQNVHGEEEQSGEVQSMFTFIVDSYSTVGSHQKLQLIFCTFLVEMVLWSTVMAVETFYLERHGWSATNTGLMLSVVSLFYGVVSFLSGWIFRHARWFVIWAPYPSLVLLSLFLPLIGITTSPWGLILINLACGTLTGVVELTSIFNFRILLNGSPVAFSLTDICFCAGGMTGALVGTALNDSMPSTFTALLLLGSVSACFGLPACYLAVQLYGEWVGKGEWLGVPALGVACKSPLHPFELIEGTEL